MLGLIFQVVKVGALNRGRFLGSAPSKMPSAMRMEKTKPELSFHSGCVGTRFTAWEVKEDSGAFGPHLTELDKRGRC